jgi:hypothetical protein
MFLFQKNQEKKRGRHEQRSGQARWPAASLLTVALAEGGQVAAAGGGQPRGAGHVDRDAVVLAQRVAEALHGGGAHHRALDAVAAGLGRLALRAPGLHVLRAPDQAGHRAAAVGRRPRRRRGGLRRRADREEREDDDGGEAGRGC